MHWEMACPGARTDYMRRRKRIWSIGKCLLHSPPEVRERRDRRKANLLGTSTRTCPDEKEQASYCSEGHNMQESLQTTGPTTYVREDDTNSILTSF